MPSFRALDAQPRDREKVDVKGKPLFKHFAMKVKSFMHHNALERTNNIGPP
jgi:hypothetical protein